MCDRVSRNLHNGWNRTTGDWGQAAIRSGLTVISSKCYTPSMIKRNSQILSICFFACDLAMTAAAWVLAYYLRFETGIIPQYKPPP